jgi:hypothetical protein
MNMPEMVKAKQMKRAPTKERQTGVTLEGTAVPEWFAMR